MDFSAALHALKMGRKVTRKDWWDKGVFCAVQFPDVNSANTEPYIYMIKGEKRFPLDLSCESLFAMDWREAE